MEHFTEIPTIEGVGALLPTAALSPLWKESLFGKEVSVGYFRHFNMPLVTTVGVVGQSTDVPLFDLGDSVSSIVAVRWSTDGVVPGLRYRDEAVCNVFRSRRPRQRLHGEYVR